MNTKQRKDHGDKKALLLLVGLPIGIALTGITITACAQLPQGVVTGKEHEPEFQYTTCTPVGKVMSCTTQTDPECWRIDYKHLDDTDWQCVSKTEYKATSVGDHYTAHED